MDQKRGDILLAYSLDGHRRYVIFLIILQLHKEFHVTEQLHRWSPEIVEHSAGAGFWLTLRLYAEHYAHGFHDQLHKTRRVLQGQTHRYKHTDKNTNTSE